MKFLVLFVATAALASASYIGTKNVDVKQDGTIVIRGDYGKQIEITKQYGPYGQKNIEIEVTGPNTVAKKIQINDDNQIQVESGVEYQIPENYEEFRGKRSSFVGQEDVLAEIFNQYQGTVDQQSFQQLLNQIQNAVLKGKINSEVLDVLQALNENQYVSGQGIYQYAPYNKAIYAKYGQLLNKYYQQQQYGIYGNQQQSIYAQKVEQQLLTSILVKLFDTKVLINYLNQQQQGVYGQQNVFNTLISQGIFDKVALVELINNPVLRTILVQQGVFEQSVLEQLLHTFGTQGVYSQTLLEQLVNKQVLQYFLAKQGIFNRYALEQIVNQKLQAYNYNNVIFGQEFLTQLVYNPVLRNILVQQGIFNQNALKQFYYTLNNQGVYNQGVYQTLLQQLVNKQVLKNALYQQGIVEQNTLEQLVNNEILGLTALLNTRFVQQTPRLSYGQLFGVASNVPEYYQNYQTLPYGDDVVGIDIKKTIIRPTTQGQYVDALYNTQRGQYAGLNTLFDTTNYNKVNSLRNIIYGQQGVYNNYQGYPHTFQGRQGIYSQVPVVEQQIL